MILNWHKRFVTLTRTCTITDLSRKELKLCIPDPQAIFNNENGSNIAARGMD